MALGQKNFDANFRHLLRSKIYFSSIFKKRFIEINTIGVPQSTMDSILASHPVAPDLILGIPKKFSLDVVEMY